MTEEQHIGWAVYKLKTGYKVARKGWNGKRMYIEMMNPTNYNYMTVPYVFMKTADDQRVPWLCSQTDLLATDWELVS